MDLYEYQGKELFRRFGIPVSDGRLATTPEEARAAAEEIGGPVVVKAQVLTGGRGKAGGIKVVEEPEDVEEAARQILGMEIREHTVRQVLVEAGADIASEMYLSILVDRAEKKPLILFSTEGGVDIEEVAEGDAVEAGQVICIIEAMKMENEVHAHRSGQVSDLSVAPGEPVKTGQVICVVAGE